MHGPVELVHLDENRVWQQCMSFCAM